MNFLDLPLQGAGGDASLRQHQGQNGTLVYFMREFGCHACIHHAVELKALHADAKSSGIEIIVIGGGNRSDATKLQVRHELPFMVLADPKREAYDAFGLDRLFGYWQKSGTFLLNSQDEIVYDNIQVGPGKSLDIAAVREKLSGGPQNSVVAVELEHVR